MATISTIKGKNIDTSKIAFSQPRVLDNGAKLVYMNYDGGRLSIQTPWMSLPWKMGVYTEGEYPKYSIDLSFKGMEDNEDLQKFHDKLREVEEKIIDGGFKNSVAWFKKKISSRDAVAEKFNHILKVSRDKETGEPDGKWPPTMKLKISRKNGQWEAGRDRSGREKPLVVKNTDGRVFNINSEDNLEDLFVKNTRTRVKMSCVGLWIASGNYMCQWQLTHSEVDIMEDEVQDNFLPDTDDEMDNDVESGKGVSIEDSDGDDNGDDNDTVDNTVDVDNTPTPVETVVSTDGVGEETQQSSPKSPPKVKRKVVRKKVASSASNN